MAFHAGLLPNGYVGVDIFFPLSGFLITCLLCEEWERTGSISFGNFCARRARRLLPALLIVVALFAAVLISLEPFPSLRPVGRPVATTLLFVNNWVGLLGHAGWLGGLTATWSLAEEAQFYLVWPVLLWLLLRLRIPSQWLVGLLGLAIASLLLADPHLWQGPGHDHYFSPLTRAAELLLGCAVAIAWRSGRLVGLLSARRTGLAATAGLGALVGLGSVAAQPNSYPKPVYFAVAICAALLIANVVVGEKSFPAPLLSAAPLRYVGRISYCLYLCHGPIDVLTYHYLGGPVLLRAAISVPLSFAVAALSWRFVESRVLRARPRNANLDALPVAEPSRAIA
jgi:peptidoglycan/LPS O-acetylase OafA/YrhL